MLQTGGAATTFGVPMAAGTVAGAILDYNMSQIGGADTQTSARQAYDRRQGEACAARMIEGVGYSETFGPTLVPIGADTAPVATPDMASRDFWGDLLWGKVRQSYDLLAFGIRTPSVSNPAKPPRRPAELGGVPTPAPGATLMGYRPALHPPQDYSPQPSRHRCPSTSSAPVAPGWVYQTRAHSLRSSGP